MEKSETDLKKERQESKPQYRDRTDILEEYARRIRNGEKVGIADLLESLVSDLMRRKRDVSMQQIPDELDNSSYSRTLYAA